LRFPFQSNEILSRATLTADLHKLKLPRPELNTVKALALARELRAFRKTFIKKKPKTRVHWVPE